MTRRRLDSGRRFAFQVKPHVKNASSRLLLLGAILPVAQLVAVAQCEYVYEPSAYVSAITHHVVIPEDGSRDEILGLTSEWAEEVLKKAPALLDLTYLLSETTADSLELTVLYEYESEEAAAEVGSQVREAMQAYWHDSADQQAFLNRMWRYINPEDNIRRSYHKIVTSSDGKDCGERCRLITSAALVRLPN